jgi:hypothetical protein
MNAFVIMYCPFLKNRQKDCKYDEIFLFQPKNIGDCADPNPFGEDNGLILVLELDGSNSPSRESAS